MKISRQGLLLFVYLTVYNLVDVSFFSQESIILLLCALPLLHLEWKKEFPIVQIWSLLNYYYYFQPLINKIPSPRGAMSPDIDILAMSILLRGQLIISCIYFFYKVCFDKFHSSIWIFNKGMNTGLDKLSESSRVVQLVVVIELIAILNILPSFNVLFIFNKVVLTAVVSYFFVYRRSEIFHSGLLLLASSLVVFNIISVLLDGLLIAMVISVLPMLYYYLHKGKYLLVFFACIIILPFAAKFNDIKVEFRELTWYSGDITLGERLGILNSLLFSGREVEKSAESELSSSDIRKAHSYHYFQRALYEHNKGKPFLSGSTYWIIFVKPIPRIFWVNKPKELSGSVISKDYNMLDKSDFNTSMNLPFWVELYINFGEYGLYVGSLLMTLFFIYLTNKTIINAFNYLDTGIKFALLIPFLGIESNFSLMLGGVMGLIGFMIVTKLFASERNLTN